MEISQIVDNIRRRTAYFRYFNWSEWATTTTKAESLKERVFWDPFLFRCFPLRLFCKNELQFLLLLEATFILCEFNVITKYYNLFIGKINHKGMYHSIWFDLSFHFQQFTQLPMHLSNIQLGSTFWGADRVCGGNHAAWNLNQQRFLICQRLSTLSAASATRMLEIIICIVVDIFRCYR